MKVEMAENESIQDVPETHEEHEGTGRMTFQE